MQSHQAPGNRLSSLRVPLMTPRAWLICYDIAHHQRLRRVAHELEEAGDRIQKSMFECGLTPDALAALHQRIQHQIDSAEDKVLYLPICEYCRRATVWQGKMAPAAAEPFWIV